MIDKKNSRVGKELLKFFTIKTKRFITLYEYTLVKQDDSYPSIIITSHTLTKMDVDGTTVKYVISEGSEKISEEIISVKTSKERYAFLSTLFNKFENSFTAISDVNEYEKYRQITNWLDSEMAQSKDVIDSLNNEEKTKLIDAIFCNLFMPAFLPSEPLVKKGLDAINTYRKYGRIYLYDGNGNDIIVSDVTMSKVVDSLEAGECNIYYTPVNEDDEDGEDEAVGVGINEVIDPEFIRFDAEV